MIVGNIDLEILNRKKELLERWYKVKETIENKPYLHSYNETDIPKIIELLKRISIKEIEGELEFLPPYLKKIDIVLHTYIKETKTFSEELKIKINLNQLLNIINSKPNK
ncbi:hypothetical protein SAMN05216474_0790 [Lishizhenia tianjinensis]|uniref:Uncharacterized protein n=1 Tax=Lishizhenia tianjinensis TaxID=477690 RepID=A0A1I6YBN4_9FLAO|nr:hypothetical protein [Lishizhenia tianjinensis]SFT47929.1 hypothetical protein SAMN05216474_0790 [Lishizhenia tianjinensis]